MDNFTLSAVGHNEGNAASGDRFDSADAEVLREFGIFGFVDTVAGGVPVNRGLLVEGN